MFFALLCHVWRMANFITQERFLLEFLLFCISVSSRFFFLLKNEQKKKKRDSTIIKAIIIIVLIFSLLVCFMPLLSLGGGTCGGDSGNSPKYEVVHQSAAKTFRL